MNSAISIIIPTYNEKDSILPLVSRIDNALSGCKYEIVFVDDNSGDGTAETATALSPQYPVKVIVRKNKKGLASAVVDGIKQASGQILCVMDADLQHPPEVIPKLLREIDSGADMVIASRYARGGSLQNWGATRRVISKGAIFLAHLLLPSTRHIKDPVSGFFMFDKRAIASTDLKPTGYKILLEILLCGKFHPISEVAFSFQTRTGG